MEINIIDGLAFINSEEPLIKDAQSALELIATVNYYHGANRLIIQKEAVDESFFQLSTGVAGEALQKFSNYGAKIAVVGDFSGYKSKALHAFIYECNKGNTAFFVATETEAVAKLSGTRN